MRTPVAPPPFFRKGAIMAKPSKRERLAEIQRPPCPECGMRMMAIGSHSPTFECLRCGYIGPVGQGAAEKETAASRLVLINPLRHLEDELRLISGRCRFQCTAVRLGDLRRDVE